MEMYVGELFISVLNMSITATFAIVAVLLVRPLLNKAPKLLSYVLWFVILFRLLCPISFESPISIFGLFGAGSTTMEHIPSNIGTMPQPQVNAVIPVFTGTINASLPPATPAASINPMQVIMFMLSFVWALGAVLMLGYSLVSYLLLKQRVSTAIIQNANIFRSDRISSPFVCGFISPKIYLPSKLESSEKDYILLHEQTHIRRRDYLVKAVWFFAVCLHWFNPLVWLSFRLMSRDMEMSCDEAVLRDMGESIKADYSASLLALSVPGRPFAGSPLAFGETGTFARVKNILNYRRPAFWVIAAALAAVILVSAVLAANPEKPVNEQSLARQFLGYKTEYVGDNSKVGGIISLLEFPEDVSYASFALQTASEPYGVTVHLNTSTAAKEHYAEPLQRQQFEHAAVIMFSLIGNVGEINFRLSDGNADNELELLYTRAWADKRCGRDVRAFTESEADFDKLLTGETAAATSGD